MQNNIYKIFSTQCQAFGALSGMHFGLIAALLITWSIPQQSRHQQERENSSRIIHQSLVTEITGNENAAANSTVQPKLRKLPFGREAATILFVSQEISDFGHEDEAAKKLAKAIVKESSEAALDPLLVAAVVKFESSFRAHARSHRGAFGLMQVMPATERGLLKTIDTSLLSLHEKQLRLGSQYLAELQKRFRGNMYHSLIAYNWGPTNLALALRNGKQIPSCAVKYANNIIAQQASWRGEMRRNANRI